MTLPERPPAEVRRARWTLRGRLTALLVGVAFYLTTFSVWFVVHTGNAASDLSHRSQNISYLYGEIATRVSAMDAAVNQTHTPIPVEPAERLRFAANLRKSVLDHGGRAAPDQFASVPAAMRVPIARADDAITELQNGLLEFSSLVELNRVADAEARGLKLDSLMHDLESILYLGQQQGLAGMLAQADDLQEIGRYGIRAAAIWLLVGALAFGGIVWLLWRQVDRPLRILERGLARVAQGDLDVRLPVVRSDELGRLTAHFNQMTEVLHHRAQEQGRFVAAGELIAGIAHEVNNPLMAVTAVVSNRLADDKDLSPEIREELLQVLRQSRRAGKLVSGLLRFVRPNPTGQSDFDLDDVTQEALDLVSHRFPVEEIQVRYEAAAGKARVKGDPGKVVQVLVNLLSNAADALREVPAPRSIQIVSRLLDGKVLLSIEDNGPGIPSHVTARLFHPFVSSKGDRGTGLGLYISREIARDAGGNIVLEPADLGGARFVLSLLAAATGLQGTSPTPVPVGKQGPRIAGKAILVVDDETAVRSPIARYLRRRGADVVEAGDGLEGLAQLARGKFDVILADVRMPRMDGPAFYRGILERFPDQARKVMFLSGDISQLTGLELSGVGSERIIVKPVELAILEERIADHLPAH